MADTNDIPISRLDTEGGKWGGKCDDVISHPPENRVSTSVLPISAEELKHNDGGDRWETKAVAASLFLTPVEVGKLLNVTKRAINWGAAKGAYPGAVKVMENNVEVWRIPFAALPAEAQSRYLLEHAPRQLPTDEKTRVLNLNAKTINDAIADIGEGRPATHSKMLAVPIIEQAQREALWAKWERATNKEKAKGKRALERMQAWERHRQAGLTRIADIETAIRKQFGSQETSHATLWRYRQRIEGQHPDLWLPLLTTDYGDGRPCLEIEAVAWEWFVSEWGIQSEPPVAVVYRRYVQEAKKHGWEIPSADWFEERVKEIPEPVVTYLRKGKKALEEALPPILRDYEKLPLHGVWCSDFRRLDVWCEIDDEICRPWMIAWQEVRTRKILAWRLVKNPNPDAVRLCFRDAMLAAKALPAAIYVDNGMEYAAKCNTGGATRRNRFKQRDDDCWGIFTLLNVPIIWSTPGYAWSKPIESFWAGFKRNLENRREFERAYVGASPDQRPENAAPNKEKAAGVAVPEKRIKEVICEEITAFNERDGHRGHGMNKRSPNAVYAELAAAPELLTRQPTPQQLRLCLARAEAVKLDRYGQFTLHKTTYGAEKLATERLPGVTYTALYDPENLARPVAVLLHGEFYCEAAPIGRVAFGDTEAVREHAKHKARLRKAIRSAGDAMAGMDRAKRIKGDETPPAVEPPAIAPASPLEATLEDLSGDFEALPVALASARTPDPTGQDDDILADMLAWREAERGKAQKALEDDDFADFSTERSAW